MPAIAHLFMGGMVGYFLYLISAKRFSKYHVMILMLATYVGPDIGWVLGIGNFTHTYVGFLIFAIVLSFFYSYFTRFSPDFKKRELIDKGYNRVPYFNTFFLACAGGIMHVYLDGVMNHQGKFHLFPEIGSMEEFIMSINDFFNFWYDPLVPANMVVALIVGMCFVMGFIVFFLHALKDMGPRFVLKIGAYMGAFMVLYFFLGNLTTLHAEGGAIVYVTLFWVIPFGLCAVAMECPPSRRPVADRSKLKQQYIPALLGLGLTFTMILIIIGIALLVLVDTLVPLITGLWAPLSPHGASIRLLVISLGVLLISFGGWNVFTYVYFKTRKDVNVNVMVASSLIFLGGFASALLCTIIFSSGTVIVDIIFAIYDAGLIISPEGLLSALIGLGVVFAALAGLNFVIGTGIILKKKNIFRLAFLVNASLAWTVIGLYICCLLNQNEVKQRYF